MHEMYELKEMLCDELQKITKKGELSAGSLDAVDKLTHSIKSIETIMAMDGYSNDGEYMMNEGGSYARRRDSMGRYSRDDSYARGDRRGGYSRDDEMEGLKADLHEMLRDAQSEEQKQMIRKWIKQVDR